MFLKITPLIPDQSKITQQNFSGDSAGVSQYFCPNCGKNYTYHSSLYRHLRYECGRDPEFICPFCPHKTKRKSSLQGHISNRHPDIAQ